jgi:MFS family permease
MANQAQNQPTAAYWLSMIGALIGLLAALSVLAFSVFVGAFTLGIGFVISAPFGIWMLITSLLMMYFAGKLRSEPKEHTKWGILIIVFAVIGVGTVLGLIGGILALVYNPNPPAAPQYTPQQQYYGPPPQPAAYQQPTNFCPQCGTQLPANAHFCPNCGRQQY